MKKSIKVFAVAVCTMLIFPVYGMCDNVGGNLDTQVNSIIAAGDQSTMEVTLEELNLKAQKCRQLANKTAAQIEQCEQVSRSIILLEQALNQD